MMNNDLCCVKVAEKPCAKCAEVILYLRDKHRTIDDLRTRLRDCQERVERLRRRVARYEVAQDCVERISTTRLQFAEHTDWPIAPTVADMRKAYLQAVADDNDTAKLKALTRLLLYDHMRACSERAYCAGWMSGLHRGLQRCVREQVCDIGAYGISPTDLELLTVLVAEAGGWWVWPHEAPEPVFVRNEDGN